MARDKTDRTDRTKAALAYAEKEVRDFLKAAPPRVEFGRGPVAYYLWWHLNLTWADGPRGPYINVSDTSASVLCILALEYEDVHNLVREIVASRINNDRPLTNDLKDFAFLALLDELPKPRTKTGPKVSKHFERDMFIIWTLAEMEKNFGIDPTEGDERSARLPPNGMGILAKCFRDGGRHEVTAKAIKDVWLDKKKRQKAHRISEAIANYKEPSVNSLADLLGYGGN